MQNIGFTDTIVPQLLHTQDELPDERIPSSLNSTNVCLYIGV